MPSPTDLEGGILLSQIPPLDFVLWIHPNDKADQPEWCWQVHLGNNPASHQESIINAGLENTRVLAEQEGQRFLYTFLKLFRDMLGHPNVQISQREHPTDPFPA